MNIHSCQGGTHGAQRAKIRHQGATACCRRRLLCQKGLRQLHCGGHSQGRRSCPGSHVCALQEQGRTLHGDDCPRARAGSPKGQAGAGYIRAPGRHPCHHGELCARCGLPRGSRALDRNPGRGCHERVRASFRQSDRLMREVFARLLASAAEAGEIDPDLDFEAVSCWLYALVDGLIARTAIDPDFDMERHSALFRRLVRQALQPVRD